MIAKSCVACYQGCMSQRFEMECFAKVVEEGSFTAAARALGVSKSMVSREVASLEKRLDNVVFDRTTRRGGARPPS